MDALWVQFDEKLVVFAREADKFLNRLEQWAVLFFFYLELLTLNIDSSVAVASVVLLLLELGLSFLFLLLHVDLLSHFAFFIDFLV